MGNTKIDCSPAGLEALTEEAMAHAKSVGFSRSWQRLHGWGWRCFVRWVGASATKDGHELGDLVQGFLASRGIEEHVKGRELRPIDEKLRGTMRALKLFALHGTFPVHRGGRPVLCLRTESRAHVDGFVEHLREDRGLAEQTVEARRRLAENLFHFMEVHGVIAAGDIGPQVLSAYVASRSHLRPHTLAMNLDGVRSLLRYLCMRGLVSAEILSSLPKVRVRRNTGIPTIWTKDEVDRLLGAVDRTSPLGKRDFAILLLASRLGLRAGDIRALRTDDLRWEEARIEFQQAKTGVPQSLPLTEEIGTALIDYLRHGRPPTAHREVFLTATAPFRPFPSSNSFHKVITKYRLQAGIDAPPNSSCGLHSLRHTVATRLLEAGTPLETISSVMGHIGPETTRIYLKVDIAALRTAALDPLEVADA
jgi:integrase